MKIETANQLERADALTGSNVRKTGGMV